MDQLLKKGQNILITIKRIGINGEGIGYYKRKAVFVEGAIPPEEVYVEITDVKDKYAKGTLKKIKIKAQKRVKPFCKHYYECGGCQLQHIDYSEQLNFKIEMLEESFERYSGYERSDIKFNDIVYAENDKNYRYKLQMPVRNTRNGLVAGLYKTGTNKLTPVLNCPVQNDTINRTLRKVLSICDDYNINAFDPKTMRGLLRYVVIRIAKKTKEMQVTLVVTIFNHVLKDAALKIGRIDGVESVAISKNRDAKNHEIFGETVEILEGKNYITEGINDIRYDLTPKSFYQLNPSAAELMYNIIKENIDFSKKPIIVDAFSGSGTIGLYLARDAREVIGVDLSKESIYAAKHNIKKNNFNNVTYEQGDVLQTLKDFYDEGYNPDVLIIDPPRKGLDNKTMDLFLRKPIKQIIYVSCNPSTLAKNIKVLSKKYKIKSVTPVDMFPHTSHIESVTLLELK